MAELNQNEAKNGRKRSVPPIGKRFSRDNQPSPEAKKEGWNRRKQAIVFMDKVVEFMTMSEAEYSAVDQSKLSRGDLMAYKYVEHALNDTRILTHFIDKHVPTAQAVDITSNGETITGYAIEIIDKSDDVESNDTENTDDKTL